MSKLQQALVDFNALCKAQDILSESMEELREEVNSDTESYNQLAQDMSFLQTKFDELAAIHDQAKRVLEDKNAEISRLKSANILQNTRLKELQKLDPKRLEKTNKEQKKQIATLKEDKAKMNNERKRALEQHKILLRKRQDQGLVSVFKDPKTGNELRLIPNMVVGENGVHGSHPGTPLVEFYHHQTGILRRGQLQTTGEVGWTSATGSMPSKEETNIAAASIIDYCQTRKIKLPKGI